MAILITGANRGIGRALFDSYIAKKRSVRGTSRQTQAPFLPLDVTDPASFSTLSKLLAEDPLDLLICNAGVYLDKTENIDAGYGADLWAQTFAANVTGAFLSVQTVLSNLSIGNHPKIALLSSQMASHENASGGSYIYRASKAAVLNLGRNLAVDLYPLGIAVGVFDPGWTRTDMGGDSADISVGESANGLIEQIDALSLKTTGGFIKWNGELQKF